MLQRDEATGIGIVVSKNSTHHVEIIGQLNRVKKYEISGFQQLRTHAMEEAVPLREILQEQRQAEQVRASELLQHNIAAYPTQWGQQFL